MSVSLNLELHDAELIEVVLDRINESLRLRFRLEDGEDRRTEIQGVKAFRCEDLTLQNVVSQVRRASRGEIAGKDLEHWLKWVTSLSDASSWLSNERKSEWLAACEGGGRWSC